MNARDDQRVVSHASEVEVCAADWFGRRQFWDWKPEDQVALDAWLDLALAHRVAYWRLEAAWGRTSRLAAIDKLGREDAAPLMTLRSGLSGATKFAAVFVAVVLLGFAAGTASLFHQSSQTYSTAVGQMRAITLADGSHIELNTDTVLRAGVKGKSRFAELEKGEAFFQIAHDANHPFFVKVNGHRIIDLGTKFLVRQDANRLQVTLVEGKARIDSLTSNAQSAVLKPGDTAVATSTSLRVTPGTRQELADKLSWRDGMLVFDNMTLGDAVVEFNRYNRTKLVIVGSSVRRTPIAGKFPINGVSRFGEVVKHVFGLHVADEGETMVISR